VAAGVALAAYPLTAAGSHQAVLAVVGLGAVAVVAVAVAAGRTAPLPWALAALLAEYAGALRSGGGVDAAAPLYAAALFACAELAYWSCDLRRVGIVDPAALSTRLLTIAAMTAVGALGAGVATAAASVAASGGGVTPVALGTVCAVGAVGVLAWLGDRATGTQRPGSDSTAGAPPSSLPKTSR
jgi:hypothetical protein